MKKIKILAITTLMLVCQSIWAQNHLDVEGDAWVKERLEINTSAPNAGEYIWNPTGLDLRFFTGFAERLRINSTSEGGDIMIFAMDTITSAQDATAGNVVRLTDGTLALRHYKIGDMAQGGIVFWVDETGEHGLVSSHSDIESISGDFNHEWSTVFEFTGSTGDGIGAGVINTMLIISAQRGDTDSAARLCADLEEAGYGDWYLPSKGELDLLYDNLQTAGIGNFTNTFYLSSSEFDEIDAWRQNFDNGSQIVNVKNIGDRVRAIRSF